MEMLGTGGWDYMRKMLGDHKQPWFPEITTHQTKFFLRNDGVLYVHHKVGEYGHELYVYPTGAWDKTDIFPDRIEESHYNGEKVTWTRRER